MQCDFCFDLTATHIQTCCLRSICDFCSVSAECLCKSNHVETASIDESTFDLYLSLTADLVIREIQCLRVDHLYEIKMELTKQKKEFQEFPRDKGFRHKRFDLIEEDLAGLMESLEKLKFYGDLLVSDLSSKPPRVDHIKYLPFLRSHTLNQRSTKIYQSLSSYDDVNLTLPKRPETLFTLFRCNDCFYKIVKGSKLEVKGDIIYVPEVRTIATDRYFWIQDGTKMKGFDVRNGTLIEVHSLNSVPQKVSSYGEIVCFSSGSKIYTFKGDRLLWSFPIDQMSIITQILVTKSFIIIFFGTYPFHIYNIEGVLLKRSTFSGLRGNRLFYSEDYDVLYHLGQNHSDDIHDLVYRNYNFEILKTEVLDLREEFNCLVLV